ADWTCPPTNQHRIELLPSAVPPKGRIYRMSAAELDELRRQLENLTSKGWIRPSTSEFGAPILFVPKGNGEFRMCIDYRGLNKITRKSTEPLPRIDDLLDMVQGCTIFSKIDLKSGYHQIEMAEGGGDQGDGGKGKGGVLASNGQKKQNGGGKWEDRFAALQEAEGGPESGGSQTDSLAPPRNIFKDAFGPTPMDVETGERNGEERGVFQDTPPLEDVVMQEARGADDAEEQNSLEDRMRRVAEWLLQCLQNRYANLPEEFWDDAYRSLIPLLENSGSLRTALEKGLQEQLTTTTPQCVYIARKFYHKLFSS
ncbi:hypothetical protein CBR_g5702, partial [Chara braunii]